MWSFPRFLVLRSALLFMVISCFSRFFLALFSLDELLGDASVATRGGIGWPPAAVCHMQNRTGISIAEGSKSNTTSAATGRPRPGLGHLQMP
jgi:hypothetical protein